MRKTSITYSIAQVVLLVLFLWPGPALAGGLEKAPGFSLKDIEKPQEDDVTLPSLEGKVLLINIFTTTCPVCRAEFPALIAINDRYSDRDDVQVVGIAIDPMVEPVKSLVDVIGINYTVLMGELQTLVAWNVKGFPTSFLINKEGKIYKRYIGLQDKSVFVSDMEELVEEE